MASYEQDEQPQITLARDEFTVRRRDLKNHPEAVEATSRIDVTDDYGNVTTWVVDLFRLEGKVTALLQVVSASGSTRMVIPPPVTSAIARHQAGLITKQRSKTMKRRIEDARARGEQVGNPAALAAARKARRHK